MDKDKLESLLRNMLSELQKLTTQAHNLRMRATEIDQRVIELQHGIARLAHHGRVNPFRVRRAVRQPMRRRRPIHRRAAVRGSVQE